MTKNKLLLINRKDGGREQHAKETYFSKNLYTGDSCCIIIINFSEKFRDVIDKILEWFFELNFDN